MNINRIPKEIRALVPYSLKRFLVQMYVRWNMRSSPGTLDKPRISLASILPSQGSFIRGGKVKLTHLRKKFGEYNNGYNMLYLVSSTLPGFPDIWIDEAKRKGVKVVWNQNGVGTPAWTPIWQKINDAMKPILKADYVVYQSEFCRDEANDMVAHFDGPQSVIYNCVDEEALKPAEPPIPLDPIYLLVTGTHMTPEKLFIPLETTRLLLDRGFEVKLLIYGPSEWPEAERETEAKIAALNLGNYVEQHGKYLQKDSPAIYRRGHILLHMKYMDPSPTTVLSAMTSGVPVIGSKSGGVVELVAPTAGILLDVPVSREKLYYPSHQAVAEAVEKIMKDWSTWSRGAREHALKNFNATGWVNAHEQIFKQVLRNES